MKAIIDGKTYNTETAVEIGGLGSDGYTSRSDFRYWGATLYRTKKGRYFMEGEGGPMSPFAHSIQNGSTGGSGIRVLEPEEALRLAERDLDADTIAEHFADYIEEA